MSQDLRALLDRLESGLSERGLDLMQPFSCALVNERLSPAQRLPLPHPTEDALGVLIGNTRAIWQPFLDQLPERTRVYPHPFDIYVERSVHEVLLDLDWRLSTSGTRSLPEPPRSEPSTTEIPAPDPHTVWARFSHQMRPRPLAIQAICDASGLARLGSAHLNLHPVYGPWFALRAVLIFPLPPPAPLPSPAQLPRDEGDAQAARAFADFQAGAPLPRSARPAPLVLNDEQRKFLYLRDLYSVGRQHRYTDAQIAYHYAKDPTLLHNLSLTPIPPAP